VTDDELPEEFVKVWQDAQCNVSKLIELAPDGCATKALVEAAEALERSKDLTEKAQQIAEASDE
jgi:hypothetical protein